MMEETPQSISIETTTVFSAEQQEEQEQELGIFETQISNDKDRNSKSLMPPPVSSSLSALPAVAAMSNKKKSLLALGFISGFAALYTGLAMTFTNRANDTTNGSNTGNGGNGNGSNGPSAITIQRSRLFYFNESSLGGYEECSDLHQLDCMICPITRLGDSDTVYTRPYTSFVTLDTCAKSKACRHCFHSIHAQIFHFSIEE